MKSPRFGPAAPEVPAGSHFHLTLWSPRKLEPPQGSEVHWFAVTEQTGAPQFPGLGRKPLFGFGCQMDKQVDAWHPCTAGVRASGGVGVWVWACGWGLPNSL